MKYLIPFSKLKEAIKVVATNGRLKVDLSYEELVTLIKLLLTGIDVDEEFYRSTYPDVAEAIDLGTYRSAKQHFVENGYFEGRRPFAIAVDAEWYTANNPDVEEGIKLGTIASASDHFEEHGYVEGRPPSAL